MPQPTGPVPEPRTLAALASALHTMHPGTGWTWVVVADDLRSFVEMHGYSDALAAAILAVLADDFWAEARAQERARLRTRGERMALELPPDHRSPHLLFLEALLDPEP